MNGGKGSAGEVRKKKRGEAGKEEEGVQRVGGAVGTRRGRVGREKHKASRKMSWGRREDVGERRVTRRHITPEKGEYKVRGEGGLQATEIRFRAGVKGPELRAENQALLTPVQCSSLFSR